MFNVNKYDFQGNTIVINKNVVDLRAGQAGKECGHFKVFPSAAAASSSSSLIECVCSCWYIYV